MYAVVFYFSCERNYFIADYKSKKMEKLLAALSLPQVGEIKIIPASEDPEGKDGMFALELNSRMYVLRAKSDQEAEQWVNILSRLRQQGILAAQKEAEGRPTSVKAKLMKSVDMSGVEVSVAKPTEQATWIKSSKFWCC